MQTDLLHIQDDVQLPEPTDSVLSFKPFITFLRKRIAEEKTVKKRFFEEVLARFEEDPSFAEPMSAETAAARTDLLELVYACLTPPISDEKHFLWAISTPSPKKIFYCTDAFGDFFNSPRSREMYSKSAEEIERVLRYKLEYAYSLVLDRFYGIHTGMKNEMVYSYLDPSTSLNRYFRIHADTRFIEVEPKGELPELNLSSLEPRLHEMDGLETLKMLLPLDLFCFQGFSVITLTDITPRFALDNIRSAILEYSAHGANQRHQRVIDSLKTLSGENQIEFGLLPFLKLNGKPVFDSNDCSQSVLIQTAFRAGKEKEVFQSLVEHYVQNPRALFFDELDEQRALQFPFLAGLKQSGVVSYAVVPIFYNAHLAGVIEIYSRQVVLPYEHILSALEPAFPLLAQLLQNCADEFRVRVEDVIKRKFTSLQPAVQWKFNEAAWNYLKQKKISGQKHEIETISFSDVYPLYGAIDIRDSTVQRNAAFREDTRVLLETLLRALRLLKELQPLGLTDELIFRTEKWLDRISGNITTNDEILLGLFFEREVGPFLEHFKSTNPGKPDILDEFIAAKDEQQGTAFAHRRALENSMRLINATVNAYFDQAQPELQESYPCYFEKFRTDGVEYDVYIGQSIAPEKPFNLLYLKNLRLWQLKSMVEVARQTHALLSQIEVPLHTTHLIFVHANPIDISFRTDERRFDVEGAYNIRYEIIKKRIDKVLVRDSNERLTQPGKIALVYFNDREIEEYMQYIAYLQEQGYLGRELEFLDLEELQGVSGLRALRVSILYT